MPWSLALLWDRFRRAGLPAPAPELVAPAPPAPEPPPLPVAAIVDATHCPETPVRLNWPLLLDEMDHRLILSLRSAIAMAATVAVETTYRFEPVREKYNGPSRAQYFEDNYGFRTRAGRRLGNLYPGDGATYYGRGLIQLTGRDNYTTCGRVLGLPLLSEPDLALEPRISARLAALFFAEHGVAQAADLGDWPAVRRRVNGGMNGWEDFITIVRRLKVVTAGGPDPATEGTHHVVA